MRGGSKSRCLLEWVNTACGLHQAERQGLCSPLKEESFLLAGGALRADCAACS